MTALHDRPADSGDDPEEPVVEEALTTKEGWARFVAEQVEAPSEPGQTALTAMTAEQRDALAEARRDYHARLPLVNTPTIRQVLSTAACSSSSTAGRSPRGAG
jgi:predicted HicB family RNase H-like nuclease